MLFMDMIAEIRRRHLVSKESISSIARDLKLSRPTVRKHCRTQSEPVYHRQKQPTPMLGRSSRRWRPGCAPSACCPKHSGALRGLFPD